MLKKNKIHQWIELLEAIDYSGSINKASKELGITYKSAWKRLDSLKGVYSDNTIVITEIGGNQRGGTYLTSYGRNLLNQLKKHEIN
jgi:molybdate transport system regulatory protein